MERYTLVTLRYEENETFNKLEGKTKIVPPSLRPCLDERESTGTYLFYFFFLLLLTYTF